MAHNTTIQTSSYDFFTKPCGLDTRASYACPNQEVTHRLVRANTGTTSSMRALGEASGMFTLESVMDEMAHALNMEPTQAFANR